MSPQVVELIWVQAGALGVLLLGGAVAIARLWRTLLDLLRESREDRREYLAAIQASTAALERLRAEIGLLGAGLAAIQRANEQTRWRDRAASRRRVAVTADDR